MPSNPILMGIAADQVPALRAKQWKTRAVAASKQVALGWWDPNLGNSGTHTSTLCVMMQPPGRPPHNSLFLHQLQVGMYQGRMEGCEASDGLTPHWFLMTQSIKNLPLEFAGPWDQCLSPPPHRTTCLLSIKELGFTRHIAQKLLRCKAYIQNCLEKWQSQRGEHHRSPTYIHNLPNTSLLSLPQDVARLEIVQKAMDSQRSAWLLKGSV